MGDFQGFFGNERVPAIPLEPVVDPASWSAEALKNVSSWSYKLTERDIAELKAGVAAVRRAGVPIVGITRRDFPLDRFAEVLADVRRELVDGRGIVMLQGFPVDRFDRESAAIAYFGLGSYLGEAIPQNAEGHLLGHVKDLGADYSNPMIRGYMTRAEMGFHTDPAEFVGLLCLQTAKSGGESRIASSITVYNRLLENRPDIAKLLLGDWYFFDHGEVNPGQKPWHKKPIFSFEEGYFSAGSLNLHNDRAQGLPGVPDWTPAHKEAMRVYRETVADCAVDIPFVQGDIQFLNNHVMLHTRRGYEDWPEEGRKRHLLRLWLRDPTARPLHPSKREGYSGRGIVLDGVPLIAPLDVEAFT